MFVDCEPELLFDQKNFIGIKHHWIFDEMYSQAIKPDYDSDNDDVISGPDQKRLDKEVLQPFKKFDYFTIVLVDYSPKMPKETTQFQAYYKEKRLHLEFITPVRGLEAQPNKWTMALIAIFDPTNYSSLNMIEKEIVLSAPKELETDFFVDDASEIPPFDQRALSTRGIFIRYRIAEGT
jgi:ABC-type uncharacterized transport system substrate-binding protein